MRKYIEHHRDLTQGPASLKSSCAKDAPWLATGSFTTALQSKEIKYITDRKSIPLRGPDYLQHVNIFVMA